MLTFFHGWRRRIGCVTLLMTCLLTTSWLRSFDVVEELTIGKYLFCHYYGRLAWRRHGDLGAPFHEWFSRPLSVGEKWADEPLWSFQSGDWSIAHWHIVLLLGLLSAYLMLWSPRQTFLERLFAYFSVGRWRKLAGCVTLAMTIILMVNWMNEFMERRLCKATHSHPVTDVVCKWETAGGRDVRGRPRYGFAGHIRFTNTDDLAVTVPGEVQILLFDDQGSVDEQSEQLHQYNYESAPWQNHYAEDSAGHAAYNVFIPYTRPGVSEALCALQVRLLPEFGPQVVSARTSIRLREGGEHGDAFKPPKPDSRLQFQLCFLILPLTVLSACLMRVNPRVQT